MRILGIDTGYVNVGVSLYNSDTNEVEYYSHYSSTGRFGFYCWFFDLFSELKPDLIVLEKPYYSFRSASELQVIEYTGTLKLIAEMQEIDYICISPKTAKKEFTGNGNASKQVIIDKVKEVFNIELDNNHIADSIAIAYAGSK